MNDVLSGNSRIALAITEPEAGSDVRGLKTEAVLSDDGTRLIINGQKKVCSHAMPVSHSSLTYYRSAMNGKGADRTNSGLRAACTHNTFSHWSRRAVEILL